MKKVGIIIVNCNTNYVNKLQNYSLKNIKEEIGVLLWEQKNQW